MQRSNSLSETCWGWLKILLPSNWNSYKWVHRILLLLLLLLHILQTFSLVAGHEHKRRRLTWCREHTDWTLESWMKVMWTDESRFALDFHDGRLRVHRMPGEIRCLLYRRAWPLWRQERNGMGRHLAWRKDLHRGDSWQPQLWEVQDGGCSANRDTYSTREWSHLPGWQRSTSPRVHCHEKSPWFRDTVTPLAIKIAGPLAYWTRLGRIGSKTTWILSTSSIDFARACSKTWRRMEFTSTDWPRHVVWLHAQENFSMWNFQGRSQSLLECFWTNADFSETVAFLLSGSICHYQLSTMSCHS